MSLHLLKHIYTHTQIRSYVPLPHISLRPTLCLCSKGFKAAVAERKGEGKGLRGGSRQRSLAVGESQSGAYHCLSVIHHDRDREIEQMRGERRKKRKQREWTEGEEQKQRQQEVYVGAIWYLVEHHKQNTRKEHPFKDLTTGGLSITHCNHDCWGWCQW